MSPVHDAEDEAFLRQLVIPEEDRAKYLPHVPWTGEYRWFRSPNVAASSTIVDEKAHPQTTLLLQLKNTVRRRATGRSTATSGTLKPPAVCCGIKNSDSQAGDDATIDGGADVDERRRTLGAAVLIGALARFRQQRRVRRRTLMPVAAVAAGAFDVMGLDPTFSPPTSRLIQSDCRV